MFVSLEGPAWQSALFVEPVKTKQSRQLLINRICGSMGLACWLEGEACHVTNALSVPKTERLIISPSFSIADLQLPIIVGKDDNWIVGTPQIESTFR